MNTDNPFYHQKVFKSTGFDIHPTMSHEWGFGQFMQYIFNMDKAVRDKAFAALSKGCGEPRRLSKCCGASVIDNHEAFINGRPVVEYECSKCRRSCDISEPKAVVEGE